MAQIHELIGKAMTDIGAIGKDSKNAQQGFMYRGVDAVYNALNPVMAKYGLFICPEILEQHREERTTKNGSILTYTLLTIRYTVFAPDGSNITLTVIGEGMDSGDKGSNKAMSVAMKYAMFQLFMIPTEEMKDPDAETFTDIKPKAADLPKPEKPVAPSAMVTTGTAVPAQKPTTEAQRFLMVTVKKMEKEIPNFDFKAMRKKLVEENLIDDIPSDKLTMDDAAKMIDMMFQRFGK